MRWRRGILPSESFDVAISRFGTMFFSDPVAAFTNIAQALPRDGLLEDLRGER